jgi:hypothetical protein
MTQSNLSLAVAFIAVASAEELVAVKEALKARGVKAKDAVALPAAGDVVSFKDRSGAVIVGATVLGVRVGSGKGNPTMIKVQYGSGFDAATITIFPAAIVKAAPAAEAVLEAVTE